MVEVPLRADCEVVVLSINPKSDVVSPLQQSLREGEAVEVRGQHAQVVQRDGALDAFQSVRLWR